VASVGLLGIGHYLLLRSEKLLLWGVRPVTPDLVREVAAVGPAGHCAQRIAALAAAGATGIMAGLLSCDPTRQLHRITERLLPLVTER
jgi:hypothetical protein